MATDEETLDEYSTDASIFKLRPRVVVFPKSSEDVKKIVRFVNKAKKEGRDISLTPRAAGTDMTGGSLSESIVMGFTRYFNNVKEVTRDYAVVEPGVYYRDFEKETLRKGVMLPTYPASKLINAVGGMIGNNTGGEKSLRYGKTIDFVEELKVVLVDGEEYTVRPLDGETLAKKKSQENFEGQVYKQLHELVRDNYSKIKDAKPEVDKNSAGYYLWEVWDKEKGIFNLNKLITGSQGTLAIVTEIKFCVVPTKAHSKLLVVFLSDLKKLPLVTNELLKFKPDSLEIFDDHTFKFALRFFPDLIKKLEASAFSFFLSFLPEVWVFIKSIVTGRFPKMVILAEFVDDEEEKVDKMMYKARNGLEKFNVISRVSPTEKDSQKYWTIRRESFNLLRKHVKGRHTAPFIDDFIVRPERLPEFMPRLNKILDRYPLTYTIAGHAGSGNFHIIPLMNLKNEEERKIIPELSEKVYDLVLEFGGSITAEHNDGLIRSRYLEKMYGKDMIDIFEKTKDIFDPLSILNPGKKVRSDFEYAMRHIKTD